MAHTPSPPPDLVGQVFNDWTVLEYVHQDEKYCHWWRVRCVCGEIRTQRQWVIVQGKSKRCGACSRRGLSEFRHADMLIERWSREDLGGWTVLAYAGTITHNKERVSVWTCRCHCGAVIDVPRSALGKPTMPVCRHGVAPAS